MEADLEAGSTTGAANQLCLVVLLRGVVVPHLEAATVRPGMQLAVDRVGESLERLEHPFEEAALDGHRRNAGYLTSSSAICRALSAAPLRRLSLLTNSARPRPPGAPSSRADAADETGVPAGCLQRRRDVAQLDAGCVGEQLVGPLDRDRPFELGVDRQRVSGEHRNPHAGARHQQVGDVEDLARFVAQLLLLVGLERCRRRRSTRRSARR